MNTSTIINPVRTSNLTDALERLQAQAELKFDEVVQAKNLRAEGGKIILADGFGEVRFDRLTLNPNGTALGGMAQRLQIGTGKAAIKPGSKYLKDLHGLADQHATEMFDSTVNGFLQARPEKLYMLRAFVSRGAAGEIVDDGQAVLRAFLSNQYRRMDNLDMLTSVLEGVQRSGHEVELNRADISDSRMRLSFTVPGADFEAPDFLKDYVSPYPVNGRHGVTGDELPVVSAGFVASNSEVGEGGYNLRPELKVLICDNGITMDAYRDAADMIVSKKHLGAAVGEGILMSSRVAEIERDLYTEITSSAIASFIDPMFVEGMIGQLTTDSAKSVISNKVHLIEQLAKKVGIQETEQSMIIEDFIKSGQSDRAGGVLQAMTSVSQRVANPDRAAHLEAQAVMAMRLAPQVSEPVAAVA